MKPQIDKMLEISQESYVLIYTLQGFVVVGANEVMRGIRSGDLFCRMIDRFLELFLDCTIGDFNLTSSRDELFDALRYGEVTTPPRPIDKVKAWADYILLFDIMMK